MGRNQDIILKFIHGLNPFSLSFPGYESEAAMVPIDLPESPLPCTILWNFI
jgi:hypothetical protein